MITSPADLSALASTGKPGARTPSSLLIKMRNGRCCCAAAAVIRHTAAIAVHRTRYLLNAFLWGCGDIVEHEAALHFFHGDALCLVRMRPMHFPLVVVVETRQRTTAKLFRAHGGDVNEEESAFDGRRLRTWCRRRLRFCRRCLISEWLGAFHQDQRLARTRGRRTDGPAQ